MLFGALVFVPIVIAYQLWVYTKFTDKINWAKKTQEKNENISFFLFLF
jgi:cytochrome bd-type quinol oxidase subunit 2